MSAQTTFNEMLHSLTGHEEAVIEKAFGSEPLDMVGVSPTKIGRGLVLVKIMRDGADYATALRQVMGMTIREVTAHFQNEPDEVMEDEPVTEAGKEPFEPA